MFCENIVHYISKYDIIQFKDVIIPSEIFRYYFNVYYEYWVKSWGQKLHSILIYLKKMKQIIWNKLLN